MTLTTPVKVRMRPHLIIERTLHIIIIYTVQSPRFDKRVKGINISCFNIKECGN